MGLIKTPLQNQATLQYCRHNGTGGFYNGFKLTISPANMFNHPTSSSKPSCWQKGTYTLLLATDEPLSPVLLCVCLCTALPQPSTQGHEGCPNTGCRGVFCPRRIMYGQCPKALPPKARGRGCRPGPNPKGGGGGGALQPLKWFNTPRGQAAAPPVLHSPRDRKG